MRFFEPPSDLAGCLTSLYRMELVVGDGGAAVDWLQPEWANFRVFSAAVPTCRIVGHEPQRGARLTVTGPSSLANRFELASTRMWGVGLLPLGWARLVRRPAADCANLLADGEALTGFEQFGALATVFDDPGLPEDDRELAAIIAVLRAADRPSADTAVIGAVHTALVCPEVASVADLAQAAGISTRRLERVCRRHFGFPPKLLLRRQRFMRSLASFIVDGERHWNRAIDEHYTDQAHFNRDFHAFMGMGPREYAALEHPILCAFMAERAKVWGSPAQTLDAPGHSPVIADSVAGAAADCPRVPDPLR